MSFAVIQLHPDDNIVVCCRDVRAGETVSAGSLQLVVAQDVALGHKLAARGLDAGDKVIKYGTPIGSMTAPIEAGGWVHMHNMKSDYIGAHLRDTQRN
jgi:hypothetical protein